MGDPAYGPDPRDPVAPVGWCTGLVGSPAFRPQYWFVYLHTTGGHLRIHGITFEDEQTARRWAIRELPGLPEYE